MRCIAIIPARSGSKGLRDKNIKELAGKPMMAYSIEAAKSSGVFDEVMVSTDSREYAQIAEEWGAHVPFLRSSIMSSDTASSWDVVKEVLEAYERAGERFDAVCLLQPTSPLRTAEDIRGAYEVLQKAETAVVSVCEVDHSPLWCNHLPADMNLDGFLTRTDNMQRQSAGPYYRVNGAIYFVKVPALYQDTFLYREGSLAYIMPKEQSIDIDDAFDFKIADILLKEKGC